MPWSLNHYHCDNCGADWDDEWSCCCDDECPNCGLGDWSPIESEDQTFFISHDSNGFAVYESPISAGDDPCYKRVAVAATAERAAAYITYRQATYWT